MERGTPSDIALAARKLEEAEDILSAADGLDDYRKRVTEVRSDLVDQGTDEVFDEVFEDAGDE